MRWSSGFFRSRSNRIDGSGERVHVRQIMLVGVPEIQRVGKTCAHDLADAVGDFPLIVPMASMLGSE